MDAVDVFAPRRARLAQMMRDRGVDAVILAQSKDMYYLTNFYASPEERMLLCVVTREGEATFVAPQMYAEQIAAASWVKDVRLWGEAEDPGALLGRVLREKGLAAARLAVDDTMWARFFLAVRDGAPGASFVLASGLLGEMRATKAPEEIALLRQAAAIADRVFEKAARACAPGVTETEVAGLIELEMRRAGAAGPAFNTIVASGPNGAMPHHATSRRVLAPGDMVVLDFGCVWQGYCSDMTRTVGVGEPDPEAARVHDMVRVAQDIGVGKISPGLTAEEVDAATRDYLREQGYGEFFVHRTGHGIGLDVHERPYIVAGNREKLAEGMSFSVEPGVYIPGRFGVRIEDVVVVTAHGAERLTESPRALAPF